MKKLLLPEKGRNRSAIVSILLGCALLVLFIKWAVHAQPGGGNPPAQNENTNCVAGTSTNCTPGYAILAAGDVDTCGLPISVSAYISAAYSAIQVITITNTDCTTTNTTNYIAPGPFTWTWIDNPSGQTGNSGHAVFTLRHCLVLCCLRLIIMTVALDRAPTRFQYPIQLRARLILEPQL